MLANNSCQFFTGRTIYLRALRSNLFVIASGDNLWFELGLCVETSVLCDVIYLTIERPQRESIQAGSSRMGYHARLESDVRESTFELS